MAAVAMVKRWQIMPIITIIILIVASSVSRIHVLRVKR